MISLADLDYPLPEERIASHPLPRGMANLLQYRDGEISHQQFADIVGLIPPGTALYANNTKVIPARMHLYKETGAKIELFYKAQNK